MLTLTSTVTLRAITSGHGSRLLTSVMQADGGPQPFYEKLSFVLTGEHEQGEAIMRYRLK